MPVHAKWRLRKRIRAKGHDAVREERRSHLRQSCRPRDSRPQNGTYGVEVGAQTEPRVVAFARFVDRALADARAQGLTVKDIEARTGLARSAFYRWRRAEVASPRPSEVRQFCEGLGIPVATAAAILGWTGERQPTAPEPPMDPVVYQVLRRLADPNVSDAEKHAIRGTLRYLAQGMARDDESSTSASG
jgi:transcriptional regulator with XRE-family HTH domain